MCVCVVFLIFNLCIILLFSCLKAFLSPKLCPVVPGLLMGCLPAEQKPGTTAHPRWGSLEPCLHPKPLPLLLQPLSFWAHVSHKPGVQEAFLWCWLPASPYVEAVNEFPWKGRSLSGQPSCLALSISGPNTRLGSSHDSDKRIQ